jgi:Aspartyl/Asparaginyl beta-hydroxylase
MKHRVSQLMFNKYQHSQPQLPDYNPEADSEWIRTQSGLPWLQLAIDIPYQVIMKEIYNIRHLLVPHRDAYGDHLGWHSFCIHGKSYNATREDSHYKDNRPLVWTAEAQDLMPKTVKFFSQKWPADRFARVRVMLLEPGGYITVHADSDVAQLSAINISITQPKGCDFLMERHGIVPFEPGRAFWLDISNRHIVFNNSTEPRWHIIVHQNFENPEFQDLVVNSYKNLYNNINEDSQNCNT